MTINLDAGSPASAEELVGSSHRLTRRAHAILHKHAILSPMIVLILATIAFSLVNSRFIEVQNISIMLQQTAFIGALAVGQTLIILTAGVDLAIGAIAVLASVVMSKLVFANGQSVFVALLAGGLVAVVASMLNGALVTRMKLPPFIVTLGTLSIFTAVTLLYAQGQTIQLNGSSGLLWTGDLHSIGSFGFTNGVIIMLVLYAVVAFVLRRTAWGRHLYATGNDAQAARLAGVRTDRVVLSAYVVAGVIMALGAWILIGRVGGGDPNSGLNVNLQSITAVVIGGTSLFGGRGSVLGSLIGALILEVFDNGLSLAGYSPQYQVLATGVLVIAAVAVDQWIRKERA